MAQPACLVGWFSPYNYTPFLDNEGNPLPPSSMAYLADDSLHSSLRPYDAPSSQPTRSFSGYRYNDSDLFDSGYRYNDSDLFDSGSSHTSPRAEHAEADSARTGESAE